MKSLFNSRVMEPFQEVERTLESFREHTLTHPWAHLNILGWKLPLAFTKHPKYDSEIEYWANWVTLGHRAHLVHSPHPLHQCRDLSTAAWVTSYQSLAIPPLVKSFSGEADGWPSRMAWWYVGIRRFCPQSSFSPLTEAAFSLALALSLKWSFSHCIDLRGTVNQVVLTSLGQARFTKLLLHELWILGAVMPRSLKVTWG